MAEKATAERIAADMSPPGYRQAVQRIRGIKAKKEKIASVNGDIADIWAKVEGHKVNKTAGKMFAKLDVLEHEDRLTIMRDFNALCDVADWRPEGADLVDAAEGKVVQLRAGKGAGQAEGEESGDAGVGVVDQGGGEPADTSELSGDGAATSTGDAAAGAAAALKRARTRLNGDKGEAPETYTGDNSDLAGDAE